MHDPHAPLDKQAQKLADYIIDTGLEPITLSPEYYYASLPLCVIDAVFSIGVTYTATRNTVIRFCERQYWTRTLEPATPRKRGEHTIGEFLELFEGLGPDQMADDLFGNRQRTSARSGILKAEAVQRFAEVLKEVGIVDFADLTDDRLAAAEILVREIPGQKSGISFDYFQMLAGDDDLIKPDRMVQRYIGKALGVKPEQVTPDRARELLSSAMTILAGKGAIWSARQLDYTIWKTQSGG
jgi:hypothetical protein